MPNDPAAYAYDDRIAPAPYDPVMAAILVRLAEQQLASAAEQRKEPPPALGELVLAHPAGELPRFICKQIQTQWDLVGVKCRLRELPPGQTQVTDGDWDLLFAELFLLEPLVDLGRLLGDGGAFASSDPFVSLAVRKLSEVENWKDARSRLQELHRLLATDATLLPLWQLVDHFVCHRGVQGVRQQPVVFYQDVERWRVVPPEAAE
jgi:hypothetical protein